MTDDNKRPPWEKRPDTIPDERRGPKGPPWERRPTTIDEVRKGGLEPKRRKTDIER